MSKYESDRPIFDVVFLIYSPFPNLNTSTFRAYTVKCSSVENDSIMKSLM